MPDTPVFAHAAVAAPHALAAAAGQTVLAQGGNAIEAMVAMAAALSPHRTAKLPMPDAVFLMKVEPPWKPWLPQQR